MTRIGDDVLRVLARCRVEGSAVFLPEQLDRKLYLDVNKVLVALGGTWNRKAKAHVFGGSVDELFDDAITTGEYLCPKQDFNFFETPRAVANRLIALAEVLPGHRTLEPSAGQGAICDALRDAGHEVHQCVELMHENALVLLKKQYSVIENDFLKVGPVRVLDRVVMNPPFTRQQDVDHVRHASRFLKPGGVLVAVMSAGAEFRQDRKATAFRNDLCPEFERLPERSFRESGTDVSAVIARVRVR